MALEIDLTRKRQWTTPDEALAKTTVIDITRGGSACSTGFEDLQQAYYDLRTVGFSRHDLSLLGKEEVLKEEARQNPTGAPRNWRTTPARPGPPFVSEDAIGALEGSLAGGFL